MHMETMNCGYLSNTTLPPQSPDLYAPTEYAAPAYADTQYPDKLPRDDQNNNSRYSFSDTISTISEEYDLDDSLSSQMSGMDLYESSETAKPSRRKHSKKSSTSSSCSEKDSSRKDSFVYDVRLPDEQYLFFVPDLDLVKSHLMFAVREEVEVLKEKIGELMEKINSLECENNVLRQYAPPDALLQLQQAPQQQTLPSNLPHHTSS